MILLKHSSFAGLLEDIVDKRLFEYSVDAVRAYYSAQTANTTINEPNRVEFKQGDNYVLAEKQGSGSNLTVWTHRCYDVARQSSIGIQSSDGAILFDHFLARCQLHGVDFNTFVADLSRIGFTRNYFDFFGEFELRRNKKGVIPVVFKCYASRGNGAQVEYRLCASPVIDKLVPSDDDTKEIDFESIQQSLFPP